MDLNKVKPQDRVIVRVPGEKGKPASDLEGVILRVAANKSAVVVKFDDGIMRTLPIVNVLNYAGAQAQEVPPPAEPKKEEAPAPSAQEIGEQVHSAILEGKEPESEEAKKIVEEIKNPTTEGTVIGVDFNPVITNEPNKTASEVMAEADALSEDAKEKLKKLKPVKGTKVIVQTGEIDPEHKRIVELACKKHIKMFKLKQLGLTNKQIADLLSTNAGHVWNALKKYDENFALRGEAGKF